MNEANEVISCFLIGHLEEYHVTVSFVSFDAYAHLYQQIQSAGNTYISIGHRQTLTKFHNKILRISTADLKSLERNWRMEDANVKQIVRSIGSAE